MAWFSPPGSIGSIKQKPSTPLLPFRATPASFLPNPSLFILPEKSALMWSGCDKSAVDHPEKSAADRNAIPRQVPWADADHLRSKIKPQSHVRLDGLAGVRQKTQLLLWLVSAGKPLTHISICGRKAIKAFPYIEREGGEEIGASTWYSVTGWPQQ